MAGFLFIGPDFLICNKAPPRGTVIVKRPGFMAKIDKHTEQMLVHKAEKVLNMRELPPPLRRAQLRDGSHLGNIMAYDVTPIKCLSALEADFPSLRVHDFQHLAPFTADENEEIPLKERPETASS